MRILIFGAGAIGQAFGGFLSKEHEVTLLGRRRFLSAIRKKGLQVSGIWGRHRFRRFSFAESVEDIRRTRVEYDLVLLCVKSYDTLAAARQIKKILKPKTLVLSLQNGLGNIEILRRQLPAGQILGARVIFGVEISAPARIRITVIAHPTAVGETGTRTLTPRVRTLVRVLNRAGLPAAGTRDVSGLLWAKVVYNAALNPLASLLGCHYGRLTEDPLTRRLMNEVIREVYLVARRAGVGIKPFSADRYIQKFYAQLVPRTYHHHPSMLQDLRAHKRTEIDAISGTVVRMARKYRIKTPTNDMLFRLIKKAESI